MSDGDDYPSAVFGKRLLTVNYKHVLLGNENFWMPATTGMQTTGFHQTALSFQAVNRNTTGSK